MNKLCLNAYFEEIMLEIAKKWYGIMSLKRVQKTSTTKSKLFGHLAQDGTFCLSKTLRNILTTCISNIVK
jgi:hypothetical protein